MGVRKEKLLGQWTKLSLHKEGVTTRFSHLCSQGFVVKLFPQNLDNRCPSREGGHVFTRHRLYIISDFRMWLLGKEDMFLQGTDSTL